MEEEQIRSWRTQFSVAVLHIIESVDFRLNVEPFLVGVGENLGAWRRRFKLTLAGLVIVVIVLVAVKDLVVNVVNRVGKWIQIFLLVFLGHVTVVFFFLETNLNRNSASVKVSLSVEIFNRQQSTFLIFVVNKSPKLSVL